MAKINAENVTVRFDGSGRFISCECDGHRYHVWLNSVNMPVDSVMYKNPPLGAKPHTEGYFYTRRLSIDSAFGGALLKQMMDKAVADDLFSKALVDEQNRTEEENRRRRAEALVGRKEDEGVALFDLLAETIKADIIGSESGGLRERIVEKLRGIDENYDPGLPRGLIPTSNGAGESHG